MINFCISTNRQLLLIKFVMIGWFGATACIHPFMSVHMKELGITVRETAVIHTLLPITQFLATPLAGFIADRFGRYRDYLLASIIATVVLGTAMLYVPTRTKEISNNYSITHCANESNIETLWLRSNTCDPMCIYNCDMSCDSHGDLLKPNISSISARPVTNLSCRISVAVSLTSNETIDSDVCRPWLDRNCSVSCSSSGPCESSGFGKGSLTFWLYMVLRIVYNIFTAIAYTLVDSTAIALTEPHGDEKGETSGQYGRQRLWAMLSVGVFSPIAGLLVDVWSGQGQMNYAPAFHAYNVLALLTAAAAWRLEIKVPTKLPQLKELRPLFQSPSILCLLLAVFWLGTVWGFLEIFLFWFLVDELHSPNYLLGLTLTAGCIAGLPFLHWARLIAEKVGNVQLLCVALAAYLVRCLGYSFLYDGWWSMPFEVLEIFTYHLMWVVVATYAASITPKRLLATVQGSMGSLHYGVGLGSGSLIGGSLMHSYGARAAFRIMGGISGGLAVLYTAVFYGLLRDSDTKLKPSAEEEVAGSPTLQEHVAEVHSIQLTTINGEEKVSR